MLWGGFARGSPACVFIESKLNAEGYITIINRDMLPSDRKIIGPHFTFLEDNDPKHGGPRESLKVENGLIGIRSDASAFLQRART